MARANSIAAKIACDQSGLTAENAIKALQFIRENPGCTRKDIADAHENLEKTFPINAVTPRVSELLYSGRIKEDGNRYYGDSKRPHAKLYAV